MANGVIVISPAEAINKAEEKKKVAGNIEDLLNETKAKFGDINNLETGTYQGARKPAELKEELDTFSDFFHLAYEQICKSADDIKKIANISEQQ